MFSIYLKIIEICDIGLLLSRDAATTLLFSTLVSRHVEAEVWVAVAVL